MATALRVGGSMARPISTRVSSTRTTNSRICTVMSILRQSASLAKSVFADDLLAGQAATSCMHTRTGRHDEDIHEFVAGRSAWNVKFQGIEVAADVTGIDMRDGDVDARRRWANFLGRRYDGAGSYAARFKKVAHCVPSRRVP